MTTLWKMSMRDVGQPTRADFEWKTGIWRLIHLCLVAAEEDIVSYQEPEALDLRTREAPMARCAHLSYRQLS